MKQILPLCAFLVTALASFAPPAIASDNNPFAQLDEQWPTANERRLATGEPGPAYWQQQVDYNIKVELDTAAKRLYGNGVIDYKNNSPHSLSHLWLQLDQNRFHPESKATLSSTLSGPVDELSYRAFNNLLTRHTFEGGMRITQVAAGETPLKYAIIDTVMRVSLPEPLQPGRSISLSVDWWYQIVDLNRMSGRSGYETLPGGEAIFVLAQWYPRMVAYTDYGGWQHKGFLGAGEFTLEFGSFEVSVSLPDDYLVAATGELQNAQSVLTAAQRRRFIKGQRSDEPVMVVTAEEARRNLRQRPSRKKRVWTYKADSVRDFAFATSRAFMWDTMGLNLDGRGNWVTIMSFYPQQSAALWKPYVSRAAALALQVYSRHSIDYPYPVSVQVNGPVYGMEYPMMTFMSSRPYPDGSYWGEANLEVPESPRYSKYSLISTTIHEVGHNFFPMIVNSDERHWTWMDEGLNTFLQFLTEQQWSKDYPSRRGNPESIAERLMNKSLRPIMSDADTLRNRGTTGYAKPAVALNVLRELVLGRELFDDAFKQYAERWKFKRPTPADFFRSMEDASGTDLDWFWRTWFYEAKYVDVAVKSLKKIVISTSDPNVEAPIVREQMTGAESLIDERNEDIETLMETYPELRDFYDSYDQYAVTAQQRTDYQDLLSRLSEEEKELLKPQEYTLYVLELENIGGMITPLPLRLVYADGNSEDILLPAEIWRYNSRRISHPLVRGSDDEVVAVEFDPKRATADADAGNNRYPPVVESDRIAPVREPVPDNPLRKSRKR